MTNGLYNKYRPTSTTEMAGNVFPLESFLSKENHNRFFIFYGHSGTGKTSLSYILAKTVKATESETININCANETGVDMVREYMKYSNYPPSGGAWVLIFNEVHRLSTAAQDSLNDYLEFGLKNTYIVFTTTEIEKIIEPLRTRATMVKFDPIPTDDLFTLLRRINKAEGFGIENEVLEQIAESGYGSARKAINNLETFASGGSLTKIVEESGASIDLCRAIYQQNWSEVVRLLEVLKDENVESLRRSIVGYLVAILKKLSKPNPVLVKQIHYLSDIAPYGDKNWLLIQIAKGF